jgi:hypothetical protein
VPKNSKEEEMPTYKKINITSKIGVNFIKDIIERSGSIFHKIEQENDLGIDALISISNEISKKGI